MEVRRQKYNPLISVIIPAYNAEKYILYALKSLDNQTYFNVEGIVVDDGSTDKTLELVESYQSKKIKVKVVHQKNAGVSVARNTGMKHAKGDFLMFLDADDELPSYSIAYLYQLIQKNNASMAIGKIQESRRFVQVPLNNKSDSLNVWRGTDAIIASMSDHPACYSACGKLFDRKILDGVEFPSGKSFHEDSYFCFQVFLKEPTVVVSNYDVYFYRINYGSSSYSTFSDKHLDILSIANLKYDLINKTHPELERYSSNMVLKSRLCFLMNLAQSKTKLYDSYINQCIEEVKNRKKYFIPVGFRNRIEMFIITFGVYPLYKKVISFLRK